MRYSIIVPHCHGTHESAAQRRELESVLRRLDHCEVLTKFPTCPTVEHAVIAGLRAARGQAVVVVEPGDRYPLSQIASLLRALARADFVCGRRRRQGWRKLVERMARLPRWLLLGRDVRDPGCLFWAARREVFNGLQLLPRLVRHLPSLVARQGFRIDDVYVDEHAGMLAGENTQFATPHVAPAGLFSVWWKLRKSSLADQGTNTRRGPEAGLRTQS